jgi:ABC-type lipoprotein release transport system permease subunit
VNTFALAWRNVWRNRRRSLVTMAAMSLGLFVMVIYAALIDGYLAGMERNLLDLEVGDVQVFELEYRDGPSLYRRIDDPQDVLKKLDAAGYPATVRMLGAGLAAAGDNSAGVSFRGVDVERDAEVSGVHEHVREGEWLDPADPHGAVLGTRLARILGVGPGDEIVVVSQAADGSMANDLFIVRGVLSSIAEDVDRGGVYITIDAFRELLVVPEGVHQLIVRRPPGQTLGQTAEAVRAAAPELDVKTWRELMPTVASMFDSTQGAMYFMFLIINAAIGIVLLNAMLMAVFERIREFGVLKAVGVGPGSVMSIIMLETLVMVLVSVVAGTLLSFPALWYLVEHGLDMSKMGGGVSVAGMSFDPVWRAAVAPQTYAGPIITLIVIVGAAAFYPALRAARISPVEAMRHR